MALMDGSGDRSQAFCGLREESPGSSEQGAG